MNTDAIIAAYKHELSTYVRRGLKLRAAAVEKELIRLGCSIISPDVENVPTGSDSTPKKAPAAPKKPSKKTRP